MAKGKKQDKALNYNAVVRELREQGPKQLYLLWGREDYLREAYLAQLRQLCLPSGEDDFSYRRFDGPALELHALADAVDAVPFLAERTLIEVRGYDTNKCREGDVERLLAILSDIPDYCTLVFVMDTAFEPDGRLKVTKAFQKHGTVLQFTAQGGDALVSWVRKRFASFGKQIATEDAHQLILISGGLMNHMIPEIEKLAAYVTGDTVRRADIDAVAHKLPEAVVFEMTDRLAARDNDGAMAILAELLADKANTPIFLLSVIGQQMRRLYAAKAAQQSGLGTAYVCEVCGIRYDFIATKLLQSARRFSMKSLEDAVCLCAETDYAMKHSGADNTELLKDLLLRIAVEA